MFTSRVIEPGASFVCSVVRRVRVADLADEDHIGILTQQRTQRR